MAIPLQCLPFDSGPPLPKPRGTDKLGTDRDVCHSSGLADKWVGHLRNQERVHQEPVESIGDEGTDDLGTVHFRTSAANPRRRSSPPSGYHYLDRREPRPEHTRTPTSSVIDKTDKLQDNSIKQCGANLGLKDSVATYKKRLSPLPASSQSYSSWANNHSHPQNDRAQGPPHNSQLVRQLWTREDRAQLKTLQSRGQAGPPRIAEEKAFPTAFARQ
ncbi:hypothetical protein FSARC_10077 [Fusarium sarcochroum]|uniref:Uncharacterized protein n=1 Tax=Fusarium sarcochroum TaxID=1208366 RepID=A0A8H4TPM8_9HYPO|nr:hypothetical protein FSARC_10077 [Fusarium sarcochroum]